MALYDLFHDFEKESFKLDDTTQKKVGDTVIMLLQDTSSDVQGMAVKCLEPLVKRLPQTQIEDWFKKLIETLLGDDEDKRDIAIIALKIVITKVPIENAPNPVKKALTLLGKSLEKNVSSDIISQSLDIYSEILSRFGGILSQKHDELQAAFISELSNSKSIIQKRAILCLAALSVHSSDDLFSKLVRYIIDGIKKEEEGGEKLKTYIQCCSAISKNAGYRLGKYLKEIVPLLVKSADYIAENEEVRENIMQAFDSFLQTCPDESKEFLDYFVILAKEYLEYDPNYSYDSSGDEKEEIETDQNEGEEEGEEGGFSDDDDISWKVRKAAAKCLNTLIKTRPEFLASAYNDLCSTEDHTLVSRFKEREEGVKIDVFEVFISLLRQTLILGPSNQVLGQKEQIKVLKSVVDVIMVRIKKQLKEKSFKVRQAVFQVLKELVITLQGGLEKHIPSLIQPLSVALSDVNNSSLRLEALAFMEQLLALHKPDVFKDHYSKLSKALFLCVQDRFYKVISLSLKVCGEMVKVVASQNGTKDFESNAAQLYKSIYDRLSIQDIDKDVKEAAIESMGIYISILGNTTKKETSQALPILLERLKNEITKLTTSRTFSLIATSKEHVDLSGVLKGVIEELSTFLKKSNRALRQAGLISLSDFVLNYYKEIDTKLYPMILGEVQTLLNITKDTDISLSQLAFDLSTNILNVNPKSNTDINSLILPPALNLLESSTLQGSCLKSFCVLIQGMVSTTGYSKLLESILSTISKLKPPVPKQIFVNVGKSVAALVSKAQSNDVKSTIERFMKDISSKDENTKLLALFSLGEIGINIDLSSYKNLKTDIESCFDSGSEEVKNAASTSLGNIAVGNLAFYLPSIIESTKNDTKRRYLLLHSLKEIITQSPQEKLTLFIKDITPLLFNNCDNEEEGIRNVVAECLGKLAVVEYKSVMEKLKAQLDNKSEEVKSTIISAVKYTITEKPKPYDSSLKSDISKFLRSSLNKKEHHKVRRAGVLLLTSAIHTKPNLVVERLIDLLPVLYQNSVIDESLIRKVDVGPFKIDVDDGLDLRKSVFECMDTLLETCLTRIDTIKFASQLPHGLNDTNGDIKMLCHMMLKKLAESAQTSILTVVDDLCEPLKETLNSKLKENAVQTDKERHTDLIKSCLKAIYVVAQIKGVQDSIKFTDLISKTVKSNSNLETIYESFGKDSN